MKDYCVIFDGMNIFVKNFVSNPAMSANGAFVGGLIGTLRTIQKVLRSALPNEIVIAWDGEGGSRKKRIINKNYKEGRKPKYNRSIEIPNDEQVANRNWQHERLICDYLPELPFVQIMVDDLEADDVIAQIVHLRKNQNKIIVSSDKDFIQLLDDKTVLFRESQDEILNAKRVVEKFGIHPNNFTIARSMCGSADKSDNISGIRGIGMKTVATNLPFLMDNKMVNIQDIVQYCVQNEKSKKTFFKKVVENQEIIKENYKISQLYVPNMSIQSANYIENHLENEKLVFNKTGLIRKMFEDGLTNFDFSHMFNCCNRIMEINK